MTTLKGQAELDQYKLTRREVADYLGITERTIHKIIKDLEDTSYITRTRMGRKNLYSVNHEVPLRHHTKQDILVEDLMDTLTYRPPAELTASDESVTA